MASKLDLKTYKGKLISFNPNLNKGTFPTQKQVDQIFHNHKNALSQVFRIEIENPETFTQTVFVMKHSKARGIATDYDAKELHYGAMVQIQGYYNPDNDLHTAIGIQVRTKQNTVSSASKDINQSAVALSQATKASMANSASNSIIQNLVQQRASESIAQKLNPNYKMSNNKNISKSSTQASKSANDSTSKSIKPTINKNQQMLNKINSMKKNIKQSIDKSHAKNESNESHKHLNSHINKAPSAKVSASASKTVATNSIKSESVQNSTNIKSSTTSAQESSAYKHLNNNKSIENVNNNQGNPEDVINSAMAQVQKAGYHVQSFGDDKDDNKSRDSQPTTNIKGRNEKQNHVDSNQSTRSSKSVMPKQSSKKGNTISKASNTQRSKSPSNFLPNDSNISAIKSSSVNKNSKSSYKSQDNKSQSSSSNSSSSKADSNKKDKIINSIATKYNVPTSMATIKYKIMSQASVSASQIASSKASITKKHKLQQLKVNQQKKHHKSRATNSSNKNDKRTKIQQLKEQQEYYKQIDNQDTNTLKQLKQIQKKDSKQQAKDKDIPTTREITQKVQKNQLPTEHLSKHGKEIQKAYRQVMNSKHMTTEQLDDKLRDIYRLEGWDTFFEQDTKTFLHQLKGDLNRILDGEDVKYPLSYNHIPDVSKFKKIVELQDKQHNLNKKGN